MLYKTTDSQTWVTSEKALGFAFLVTGQILNFDSSNNFGNAT